MAGINATFTDWRGTTIKVGDSILYPSKWERGGRKTMVEAKVLKLAVEQHHRRGEDPVMLVQPLQESHARTPGTERTWYPVRLKAFDAITVLPEAEEKW